MKVVSLICAVGATLALFGCGGGDGASATSTATPTSNAPAAGAPAASAPAASTPVAAQARQVLGYFTGTSDSMNSATAAATPITAVSLDVILVAADGTLSGTLPANLIASDAAAGRASYASLSNFGATDFDPAIAHGALVTNRAAALQNIVALARTANLTGINLDFEGIDPADRDAYTRFVTDLAAQLHAIHSTLVLSVPAKTSDDSTNTWTWPYDYAALGRSADLIQVMTYDETVPGRAPGPVAGSDWMLASLQYASGQIPANKILLGLPAYGYDWNLTAGTGTSVAYKDTPALLASAGATPQWDAATQAAHVRYTAADGSAHEFWYETAQGIQAKAQFAKTLDLAGVSMWALGDEDPTFWSAVTAALN
ncbi:Putative sporulation-specific glycosylase YdhD [Burkholderia lata]|uniref:Sporulation-specific glycosylase YdhD n=1 Tax=Burkholderia lata (strain ATCC 17760 / DSM 23089 / LMG 22485 / NCIMB 9086 / R18194 / 383) TaxID=482957 RepID=A0A6P2H4S4_BURL3|nr:Putative sporulation-specific glycosylase YdhD [Burkholderia lata]